MEKKVADKSTVDEIRRRFDGDVERFSNLATGQSALIDAPLAMELITRAAVAATSPIRRVLDIGCGAGNNTLKLLQYAAAPFDCDLLDLSRPMLERAMERIAPETGGEIRLFQGDFRTVELPLEGYDVILAAAVLHHLRDDHDWETAFRKLFALTAPGGSVWITDLIAHENRAVQEMMWQRYEAHLRAQGGNEYKDKGSPMSNRKTRPVRSPGRWSFCAGSDTGRWSCCTRIPVSPPSGR